MFAVHKHYSFGFYDRFFYWPSLVDRFAPTDLPFHLAQCIMLQEVVFILFHFVHPISPLSTSWSVINDPQQRFITQSSPSFYVSQSSVRILEERLGSLGWGIRLSGSSASPSKNRGVKLLDLVIWEFVGITVWAWL
jgi:hypothetical protein